MDLVWCKLVAPRRRLVARGRDQFGTRVRLACCRYSTCPRHPGVQHGVWMRVALRSIRVCPAGQRVDQPNKSRARPRVHGVGAARQGDVCEGAARSRSERILFRTCAMALQPGVWLVCTFARRCALTSGARPGAPTCSARDGRVRNAENGGPALGPAGARAVTAIERPQGNGRPHCRLRRRAVLSVFGRVSLSGFFCCAAKKGP